MSFIQKLLLPKVAGPLGAFLMAAIMVLSVSVYTKSQRIESLSTSLTSTKSEMGLWKSAAENYRSSNLANEGTIKKQTASINALKEKSDANALAYQGRLDAARSTAREYQDEAASILRLEAGTADELDQCRAARELLEKELTQ